MRIPPPKSPEIAYPFLGMQKTDLGRQGGSGSVDNSPAYGTIVPIGALAVAVVGMAMATASSTDGKDHPERLQAWPLSRGRHRQAD